MEEKKKKTPPKTVYKKTPATKKAVDKKKDADIQKLAKRIKSIRKDKGYSNADFFAYEHDISRSQYSRYEQGEDIRYSSLIKLIRAFKMTPEEFFSQGF
jgi:hypothetical protein